LKLEAGKVPLQNFLGSSSCGGQGKILSNYGEESGQKSYNGSGTCYDAFHRGKEECQK